MELSSEDIGIIIDSLRERSHRLISRLSGNRTPKSLEESKKINDLICRLQNYDAIGKVNKSIDKAKEKIKQEQDRIIIYGREF